MLQALSDAERLKVIETVIDCAAGRLPVVAGGPVRGPGDDLTADERAELRTLLRDIGLTTRAGKTAVADAP